MQSAHGLRVWRLRKRNLYVDAELHPVGGTPANRNAGPGAASEWELRIYYGTTLTWSRRFPTRGEAVTEARTRRSDLEREGWAFHW